jgi:predicted dehydrogenase
MIEETRPEAVIVTTTDCFHAEYVTRALELGCDAICEKPLVTDAGQARAILEAEARTGRTVATTFNARHGATSEGVKKVLLSGELGRILSAEFHEYLDVVHGASYFRRWHGKIRFSGSLLVHKASHHFDQMNWWLEAEPEEVHAFGDVAFYGHNGPFRSEKCRGCPFAGQCRFHWDITKSPRDMSLYVACEDEDGYLRDGCVWSKEIDIFDKMAAQIRYMNGVLVSYSCTTYSPYEGYRIAFNGTKGRMEAWIKEQQPWQAEDYDEIRVTDNFGDTELIRIAHAEGGHGGGDTRLMDRVFRDPSAPDPYGHAAGVRDGAMSILIGIAARTSVKTGEPVKIASLTTLKPRATRA